MKSGRSIQPILFAIAGLAVGIFLGTSWNRHGLEQKANNPQAASPLSKTASGSGPKIAINPAQPVVSPAITAAGSPGALQQLRELLLSSRTPNMAACLEAIQRLPLGECQAAMEFLPFSNSPDALSLRGFIAQRWAAIDPDHALAAGLNRHDDLGATIRKTALAQIVKSKGVKALDYLPAEDGRRKSYIIGVLLPELAQSHPDEVAKFLQSNPKVRKQKSLMEEVVAAMALQSPGKAFDLVSALPDIREGANLNDRIWGAWIRRDPAGAAAALGTANPDSKADQNIFRELARVWSRNDPLTALAWLEAQPDGDVRRSAIREFQLESSAVSPNEVTRLMKLSDNVETKSQIARRYASVLARDNPNEALRWTSTIEDEPARLKARSQVFEEWSRDKPSETAAFLQQSNEEGKHSMLQRAVANWTGQEPEAALKWAQDLPQGIDRDVAVAAAIRSLRNTDAETAIGMLEQIQDKPSKEAVIVDLLDNYARKNGPAAATLATQLSPDKQQQAFNAVIRGWGFQDRNAAGNWINTLQEGPGKDSAIKAYVSVIDGYDPAMAVKWASAIQDPTERPETMMNAFQRWAEKDPSAAEKWLVDGPVEPAFKPFFQKELEERRKRPRDRD